MRCDVDFFSFKKESVFCEESRLSGYLLVNIPASIAQSVNGN
jgi:hypothetical protein